MNGPFKLVVLSFPMPLFVQTDVGAQMCPESKAQVLRREGQRIGFLPRERTTASIPAAKNDEPDQPEGFGPRGSDLELRRGGILRKH